MEKFFFINFDEKNRKKTYKMKKNIQMKEKRVKRQVEKYFPFR